MTVPFPLPCSATFSVLFDWKTAETDLLAFNVTLQAPVPEQPLPDQPAKEEPAAGVAVSVTAVPYVNACAHVEPQLTPAGLEVTAPAPLPAFVSVSVLGVSNLAVTA